MGAFDGVHLHIGIPCYGGMVTTVSFVSYIQFVMAAAKEGLNWSLSWVTNESLVTRARNKLVADMMANEKATHLMFIDADIGFKPEHIGMLINSDKEIIGGIYPKKQLPEQPVINYKHGGIVEGDIMEVRHVGNGFMMFKRSVFEKMMKKYPKTKLNIDPGDQPKIEKYLYALFDTEIVDKTYMSEDWTFCNRWANMGGKIFAHTKVLLQHVGNHTYDGENVEKLWLTHVTPIKQ